MKILVIFLALVTAVSLHANNDDFRQALIRETKKIWGVPAKQPGGLILNDMFYAKEIDAPILTYLGGVPDKVAVRSRNAR